MLLRHARIGNGERRAGHVVGRRRVPGGGSSPRARLEAEAMVVPVTLNVNSSTATATPTFTPPAGTYSSAQTVTIADTSEDAAIYYTLDGSTPTTSSTRYSAPIAVASTKTIKAVAVAAGYAQSRVSHGRLHLKRTRSSRAHCHSDNHHSGSNQRRDGVLHDQRRHSNHVINQVHGSDHFQHQRSAEVYCRSLRGLANRRCERSL